MSAVFLVVPNKVKFFGEELLAPLPNHKLEDYPLPAGLYCLLTVLAATVHNEILQFHYLFVLSVAQCEARNSLFFHMFFHREYVPSQNCLFPQHGNNSIASQQPDTLHFQNQRTK
jgi:hypothetical protein